MPRPVTLFTGQWADLSLAELLPLVKKMGYDGVELACWGDHFEVDRALAEPDYCQKEMGAARKARPEMFRHLHRISSARRCAI